MKAAIETVKTSSGKSTTKAAVFTLSDEVQSGLLVDKEYGPFKEFDVDCSDLSDAYMSVIVEAKTMKVASKKAECGYIEFSINHYASTRKNVNNQTKSIRVYIKAK